MLKRFTIENRIVLKRNLRELKKNLKLNIPLVYDNPKQLLYEFDSIVSHLPLLTILDTLTM